MSGYLFNVLRICICNVNKKNENYKRDMDGFYGNF